MMPFLIFHILRSIKMDLIGQVLQDRYRIIRQIGEGGMGRVYFGRDTRLNQDVAVKETIKLDGKEPSQYIAARIKAFQKEAELLAGKIKHPAIPKVIDYFQSDGNWYIVMEYIDGDSLEKQQADRHEAFNVGEVLQWTDQLLKILDSLHNQHPSIVHRDIKPSNIKVKNGKVYLLDFGLAKQLTGSKSTIASFVTPAFASPEHISNKEITGKSDLYSVGATIYCLLTNTEPVSVAERSVDLAGHKPDPLRNIKELCPDISSRAAEIVMHALSINPDERPENAEAMRLALENSGLAKDVTSAQAKTLPLQPVRRYEAKTRKLSDLRQSKKSWKIAAVFALIILIGLSVYAAFRLMPPTTQAKADTPAREKTPRESAVELTEQATDQIYANNYDEAKELSRQAAVSDPSYALAYAINGDAFWDTDQDEEDAKSNPKSQINKAEILKIFETREPSTEEEYAARAWAFLIDHKWERAKQDIEKVIKAKPEWAWALAVQASILTNGNCIKEKNSKESDAIIEILQKINRLKPSYANGYRLLGNQYSCIDKTEDAISAFAKAISYWASAYNYTELGTLYLNLNDKSTSKSKPKDSLENANQNFIKANEADPNFYGAYIGLARMHYSKAEYKECMDEADKALSKKDSAGGNYWWSLCRYSLANKAKDEQGFDEAAEKSAKSIDLLKRSDLDSKGTLLADYYYNDGAIHYSKAIYTYNVKYKKNQKGGKEPTRKELGVAQSSIDSAISLDADNKNYQKAKEAIGKALRVVK
jgi:serine/threonine protein kinase